jgi:hypothetical protein
MKDDWHIIYYEKVDGTSPVRDYIDSLSMREQAKALSFIRLLQEKGPERFILLCPPNRPPRKLCLVQIKKAKPA